MKDIVVEVRKGIVTGLYCDIADARFVVVDWDLIERADSHGRIGVEQDHAKLTALPADTRTEFRQAISAV
jgi:hypothetical protein